MKLNKNFKKISAAFVAATMVSSVSAVAFADKVVEDPIIIMDDEILILDPIIDESVEIEEIAPEAPIVMLEAVEPGTGDVKDSDNLTGSDIEITSVTSRYTVNDDKKTYTVTIKYSGVEGDDVQVSMLGYVYTVNDGGVPDLDDDDAIFAIDQDANKTYQGTITVKLSEDGARALTGDKLVIKIGSDATEAAQAVLVDLEGSKLVTDPFVITSVGSLMPIGLPYGYDTSSLADSLPSTVAVKGTVGSAVDQDGTVDVIWDTASLNTKPTMPAEPQTITGKLDVDGDEYQNPSELTASLMINITPLTTATATTPSAVSVSKGTEDEVKARIAAAVSAVTVQSGEITDTIAVKATDVDLNDITPDAEGTGTAKISVNGTSKNGIFNITTPIDTTVAVTVMSRILGDVDNDGEVTDLDWTFIYNHVSYISEYSGLPTWDNPEVYDGATFGAADVDNDGEITDLDWTFIYNHVSYISEYPGLPEWE